MLTFVAKMIFEMLKSIIRGQIFYLEEEEALSLFLHSYFEGLNLYTPSI